MPFDTADAAQFANYADWYQEQTELVPSWYNLNTPLLDGIKSFTDEEVDQRGKRLYFNTEEPGGHTLPSKGFPDFNRAKTGQSGSMYIRASMYVLPSVVELRTMRDLMSNKDGARLKMERFLKDLTAVGAQQQEFFAAGDGRGILAFSSSALSVGTSQTMNCHTAAAADPGHTKGAVRLRKNQYYQSFNATTGNARGLIKVRTQGKTSCVVDVLSGTVSADDPICHVNGYNKAPAGILKCLNDNPRKLQGRDTSVDDVMNVPTLDKADRRLTIPDRSTAKTIAVTYQADPSARADLTWVTTEGLMEDLRQQGYGFGRKAMDEAVPDSPKEFRDADGAKMIISPNFDDDCHAAFKPDQLKKYTEIPWGPLDDDGNTWRMLPGVNSTGSMMNARSWGTCWTIGVKTTRAGVLIKRCALPSVRQVITGV